MEEMRERLVGLGEHSMRKSYYPELQRKLTELERAREELRVSEANLRAVFDATTEAIFIHDRQGVLVRTNESMCRMYRVSPEEALRYTVADYSDPAVAATTFVEHWRRIDAGENVIFEWVARRPGDGSLFEVEVALRPVRWDGRDLILATVRDIGERKRLEAMLRQSQKLEAVGQLAGGVAHDFNNMLAAILGCADLLVEDLPEGPERESAREIARAASRAAGLTRKLLDFSRKGKQVSCAVELHDLLHSTLTLLERSIDRMIAVETRFEADRPRVLGDPTQLQHAVLNLCLNARDAMPGGGRLSLTTRDMTLSGPAEAPFFLAPGAYVQVEVADTGTGMSPEVMARVFEPFFTTKEVGKGTGLGLSAVYGCLQEHRGSVTVRSQPGKGSVFTLLLPLTDQAAQGVDEGKLPRAEHGERLLVVDDEELVRRTATQMLAALGYRVDSAVDGAQGVERYQQERYDLVLLDSVMPKMSGREALQALRRVDPGARVLMCSGYSSERNAAEFAAAQVPFVAKPYRLAELAKAVRNALSRR
ncbi:MAG: response regulator [Myxococcales bacterium]